MVLGQDGAFYLTEAAGNLVRIDLATGAKTEVASQLAMPEGLAQTPWGSFIVAEPMAARLTEIDPINGTRRPVAESPSAALNGWWGTARRPGGSCPNVCARSNREVAAFS